MKDMQTQLNNKVDKEVGKTLSSNDYSDTERNKLATLYKYDDTFVKNKLVEFSKVIENVKNGTSVYVSVAEESADVYRLAFLDSKGTIETPNLKGSKGESGIVTSAYDLGDGETITANSTILEKVRTMEQNTFATFDMFATTTTNYPVANKGLSVILNRHGSWAVATVTTIADTSDETIRHFAKTFKNLDSNEYIETDWQERI